MGLLAVISCHIGPLGFYLFPWALITHLLYFYLLLYPWAYWLSLLAMLAHWASTSFLEFSWPTCFTFTSYCAYRPVGCHFLLCWPIGLLPLSLGSHGPFAFILLFHPFLLHFCLLLGLSVVEPFYQKRVSTILPHPTPLSSIFLEICR